MNRFWHTDRERWQAFTLPLLENDESDLRDEDLWQTIANNPLRYKGRWTQGREMRMDDYYQLRFDKHRVISAIRLYTYREGRPLKCRIGVLEHKGTWKSVEEKGWDEETIEFRFKPPLDITEFRVTITEPRIERSNPLPRENKSPAWSIHEIEVQEVMFCGKWIKHWIK